MPRPDEPSTCRSGDAPPAPVLIDLNADMGEGFGAWTMGDDEALLDVVSSANIACGYHAGDAGTMARSCAAAVARGVVIGAHVSYRDLAGFGRRAMDVPPTVVRDEVLYQLAALDGMARGAGGRVRYVKPHGALYHRACTDPVVAGAVTAAVAAFDGSLGILALPGSCLLTAAAGAGLDAYAEGYLDRGYDQAGGLVPRGEPGALLDDPSAIAARAVEMVLDRCVEVAGGGMAPVEVASLCAHSDTPGAIDAARAARRALEEAGVAVRAFCRSAGDR